MYLITYNYIYLRFLLDGKYSYIRQIMLLFFLLFNRKKLFLYIIVYKIVQGVKFELYFASEKLIIEPIVKLEPGGIKPKSGPV